MKKKLFYYWYVRKHNSFKCEVTIYQHKRDKLECVGTITYASNSSRGEKSEVMNFLIRSKIIPKYFYNLSISKSSGAGYYVPACEEKGLFIKSM